MASASRQHRARNTVPVGAKGGRRRCEALHSWNGTSPVLTNRPANPAAMMRSSGCQRRASSHVRGWALNT